MRNTINSFHFCFNFGFNFNLRCYSKDLPPELCANPLYVAATRASERLYVVGWCRLTPG
jgi:hypothetical protein